MTENVHTTEVSLWESCAASGGSHGNDARGAKPMDSVNNCRTRANQRLPIRTKTKVAPLSGAFRDDFTGPARKAKPLSPGQKLDKSIVKPTKHVKGRRKR